MDGDTQLMHATFVLWGVVPQDLEGGEGVSNIGVRFKCDF